jgi:hypothetical protein
VANTLKEPFIEKWRSHLCAGEGVARAISQRADWRSHTLVSAQTIAAQRSVALAYLRSAYFPVGLTEGPAGGG